MTRSEGCRAGALDKHEELGPPTRQGCTCGPEFLRLRSDQGELVKPRGGSVNRCEYCATLAAVENCEMLVADALSGHPPSILCVLTTRTATLDMGAFKQAREKLVAAVRRRWPAAQYVYSVEFTTGYGPRSGGARRPHWNWFWKGVPLEQLAELRAVVLRIWCQQVDADRQAQYCEEILNPVGVSKYVTEHFMKASQRPPAGFTGQRFCASKGYFGEISIATARARAREALRAKREIHKAVQAGFGAHDAELIAHEALLDAASKVWVLTNDWGARVGETCHDPRRMILTRE